MAPKFKYFYTGIDGTRYLCQLAIFEEEGEQIYSFLAEHSGDRLNIKKTDGVWRYYSGREYYIESWINELGDQIDSGQFV